MRLICTLTGAQVEAKTEEAAKRLLASGGFAKVEEEAKPRRTRKKVEKEV